MVPSGWGWTSPLAAPTRGRPASGSRRHRPGRRRCRPLTSTAWPSPVVAVSSAGWGAWLTTSSTSLSRTTATCRRSRAAPARRSGDGALGHRDRGQEGAALAAGDRLLHLGRVPRTTLTSWQGPVKPLTSTDPPAEVRPGVTVSIPGGGSCSTTKDQVSVIGSQWRMQSHTCPSGAAPSGTAKVIRTPRRRVASRRRGPARVVSSLPSQRTITSSGASPGRLPLMVTSAPGRPVRREIANPPWDGCGSVATERTRPTRRVRPAANSPFPVLRACVGGLQPKGARFVASDTYQAGAGTPGW